MLTIPKITWNGNTSKSYFASPAKYERSLPDLHFQVGKEIERLQHCNKIVTGLMPAILEKLAFTNFADFEKHLDELVAESHYLLHTEKTKKYRVYNYAGMIYIHVQIN